MGLFQIETKAACYFAGLIPVTIITFAPGTENCTPNRLHSKLQDNCMGKRRDVPMQNITFTRFHQIQMNSNGIKLPNSIRKCGFLKRTIVHCCKEPHFFSSFKLNLFSKINTCKHFTRHFHPKSNNLLFFLKECVSLPQLIKSDFKSQHEVTKK